MLDDLLSTTFPDDEHSASERRYVTIGMSATGGVLVVVHTDVEETIRIISARVATRNERKFYEETQSRLKTAMSVRSTTSLP